MERTVIGITGGIGSGKSVVMDYLCNEYGAVVFLTDQIAHDLMVPGKSNYNGIVEAFGETILKEDKTIDRKKLGAIVFDNQEKLSLLNQITHPGVLRETSRRIENAKQAGCTLICLESALLFDTKLYEMCNQTWYIYADQEVRIKRLIEGRGYTREYCEEVMKKQPAENRYKEKADVVIDNSGSIFETSLQI
ncbi:MAG: dephospho-CoA kinase, partial [Lachnospiraceae bacterium]|nr:dephospho-CoA kinase [Lachnospiraceae bacterium]